MKKTIIAIISAIVLSLSLATVVYARAIAMNEDMVRDGSKHHECATEVTYSSTHYVLKCFPCCNWVEGAGVTWGGYC